MRARSRRYELAQDPRDVENYNDCIRHETLRVAVCDMCGDSEMSRSLPDPLRKLCRELFLSFFESYEMTCVGCIERGKDAQLLNQPLTDHSVVLQYSVLKTRLRTIREFVSSEKMKEEEEEDDDDAPPASAPPASAPPVGAPAAASASVDDAEMAAAKPDPPAVSS